MGCTMVVRLQICHEGTTKELPGPSFLWPNHQTDPAMEKEHSPCDENDSINVELVGAQTALDAVLSY